MSSSARPRARETDRGCGAHQDDRLGHELTKNPRRRRAQCAADGDLTRAALRTDQEQARDVHARDEEQQRRATEEQEQHGTDVPDDCFGQVNTAAP